MLAEAARRARSVRHRRPRAAVHVRRRAIELAVPTRRSRADPEARAALPGERPRRHARRARALHVRCAVPGVRGARLQPRGLAVRVGGRPLTDVVEPVGQGGARLLRRARAVRRASVTIAARDPQGDPRPARLPARRRPRLPHARPRRGHALGRRGAAHPAGDPDRLRADRACSTSSTSRRSACTSATTARLLEHARGACATSATP